MWVECKVKRCQAKYIATSQDKGEWELRGKITCNFCGESEAILLITKHGPEVPRAEIKNEGN